jgi:putative inorganic carbon (HCO3(-)) transporter
MAHHILKITNDQWIAGLMFGFVSAVFGLAVGGLTDYVLFSIQISMMLWLLNALIVIAYIQQVNREYN